jgi:H+/Cl- antiporter ClcA
MSDPAAPPVDPGSVIRSKNYRVLLVLAAVIGAVVSVASWGFLELIHAAQVGVFEDLPGELGFDSTPSWWPLPWLALAGVLVAFAIVRLPGRGGHVPWRGLGGGGVTQPIELPGVMLAAFAGLSLGVVLGPEAPLIALGMGLAIFSVRLVKRDTPDQSVGVLAAAGSFAAISAIFGSPIIGSVIIIEAAGLGGATLPVVLLPGLMAAGIGSLVFLGMGSWSGLSTSDYALSPLSLPAYSRPDLSDFGWTIVLAIAAAVVTVGIVEIARRTESVVGRRPFLLLPLAGLVIAGCAIVFFETTDQSTDQSIDLVLFSGQDDFEPLVAQAATLSQSTLALLILFKGLAWGVALGSFRGGPTFPALFLGVAGGLLASDLPGFSETPAVAALMGAMCVSMLRLPLASVIIALVLAGSAGVATAPLIIVAVVVAYVTVEVLYALRASVPGTESSAGGDAAPVPAGTAQSP